MLATRTQRHFYFAETATVQLGCGERALIRDRTQAGLDAARARGRLGGRRSVLNADKRALAVKLYNEHEMSIAKICSTMGISKPTLYS